MIQLFFNADFLYWGFVMDFRYFISYSYLYILFSIYTNITYTHTMTHKMINKEFGGKVEPLDIREDGVFSIDIEVNCPLFRLISFFI